MNWLRKIFTSKPESEGAELARLYELRLDLKARRQRLAQGTEARSDNNETLDWPTAGWQTLSGGTDAETGTEEASPVPSEEPIDWREYPYSTRRPLSSFANPDPDNQGQRTYYQ